MLADFVLVEAKIHVKSQANTNTLPPLSRSCTAVCFVNIENAGVVTPAEWSADKS